MRRFHGVSARERESSMVFGNVRLGQLDGDSLMIQGLRGAAAVTWRPSGDQLRRCGTRTVRSVPRPWRKKAREVSGRASLAGIAGGELSRRYGRERRVGFATERAVRGADGG